MLRRKKNSLDFVINVVDNFLKTNFGGLIGSGRKNPAVGLVAIDEKERLILARNYRKVNENKSFR